MTLTPETRKDIKFYFSLILGFSMLMTGCLLPPIGNISNSVLMAGGMMLTITAGCIGIDLADIVREFRLLKEGKCVDVDDFNKIEHNHSNEQTEQSE